MSCDTITHCLNDSSVPQDGLTALILAVKEGHTETVKAILAAGADVNLQEEVNKCNYASCTGPFSFRLLDILGS